MNKNGIKKKFNASIINFVGNLINFGDIFSPTRVARPNKCFWASFSLNFFPKKKKFNIFFGLAVLENGLQLSQKNTLDLLDYAKFILIFLFFVFCFLSPLICLHRYINVINLQCLIFEMILIISYKFFMNGYFET